MVFCEKLGGWIDPESVIHPTELVAGKGYVIAPVSTVTRQLWGAAGTLEPRGDGFFLRFDEPVESVGAMMSGVTAYKEMLFA